MSDSSKVKINYFCLGAFLIFVGSTLLCALGFTILLPFEITRNWPPVVCSVINSTYDPTACSCNEQLNIYDMCASKYPCLRILISYTRMQPNPLSIENAAEVSNKAILENRFKELEESASSSENVKNRKKIAWTEIYDLEDDVPPRSDILNRTRYFESVVHPRDLGVVNDDEGGYEGQDFDVTTAAANSEILIKEERVAMLYRSWDDSFHKQCSLTECGDETWNVKESRQFKDEWGRTGQSFTCYYNPAQPQTVIVKKMEQASAIHAAVWPGLCLVTGIMLWMGLCIGCCKSFRTYSAKRDDSMPFYT